MLVNVLAHSDQYKKREIRGRQRGDGLYGLRFKTLANSRLSVNIWDRML